MATITAFQSISTDGVMQGLGRPDEDDRGGFVHGGWGQGYQDEVSMSFAAEGMSEEGAFELESALDADDRDLALRLFMRLAGSSEDDIAGAEASPVWSALRELAPTLRYDAECLGDGSPPVHRLALVRQPVLLTTTVGIDPQMAGLPVDFFGGAADAAADALPDARRVTLEVGGHVADAEALARVLRRFFTE